MKKYFKNKTILVFSTFLLMGCLAFAQKFTAQASKTKVAVGEQFQISYSLNTGGSGFKTPDLNAFDVYSGPNQSSSMQFINGNMSQSISFSFIIAARKEGKYTIPPASIVVNGNRIESNELIIEVSKGSGQYRNPHAQNTNPNNQTVQSAGDNLFAKTTVSKTKAYLGEQITVSHKIYTKLNIRGFQDIRFPSYNGFWSQDLPQKPQVELSTENVDGTNYYVAEIKRSFIFAQRTGKLEIDATEIDCVVRERTSNRPQSIFDQFFGNGGYQDVVYRIKSAPVKLDIMPLPEEGKPENFNGAVGNFSFKAHVSKEKIKANEAINITININGQGNLKLLNTPLINFPEEFETYEPKINENISVNAGGVSGSKNFDYLAIPRHEGKYNISNFSFSYFNPEKKTYVTLPSPEFGINVEPGEKESNNVIGQSNQTLKEDLTILGNDIRHIRTEVVTLKKKDEYFFGSPLFYLGLSSPFVLLASFLFMRRKYIQQQSDTVAVKSRKANKMAKKKLSLAKNYMQNNSKEKFYEEILNAVNGYFTDKFNLPTSELSKETIINSLVKRNASTQLIDNFSKTIEICEAARYAPALANNNLNEIFVKAETIITQTENEIQ